MRNCNRKGVSTKSCRFLHPNFHHSEIFTGTNLFTGTIPMQLHRPVVVHPHLQATRHRLRRVVGVRHGERTHRCARLRRRDMRDTQRPGVRTALRPFNGLREGLDLHPNTVRLLHRRQIGRSNRGDHHNKVHEDIFHAPILTQATTGNKNGYKNHRTRSMSGGASAKDPRAGTSGKKSYSRY